jgi:serine/threonine protein kinase
VDPRFVVAVTESFSCDDAPDRDIILRDLTKAELAEYRHVLVMPAADVTLLDALNHEHLSPSPDTVHWVEVKDIIKQISVAVQELHKLQVIHGDIKPLNLMRVPLVFYFYGLYMYVRV